MEAIHQVDVSLISEEDQVRMRNGFDKAGIDDLAASLRSVGMLQPVLLRQIAPRGKGDPLYVVVAGHRRIRAARVAGFDKVPAQVVAGDDWTSGHDQAGHINLVQLTENVHRQDLCLADVADSLRKLAGAQVEGDRPLHVYVGKSKAWVSKRLAITSPRFPTELRALVEAGQVDDVEILGALSQLRALPDSAVAFDRAVGLAAKGMLTRDAARALVAKHKERSIARLSTDEGEDEAEEGDASHAAPGRVDVTFSMTPELHEVYERLGGAAWVRRQLKRELTKMGEEA